MRAAGDPQGPRHFSGSSPIASGKRASTSVEWTRGLKSARMSANRKRSPIDTAPFRIARVYAQNGIAGGLEIRYALHIPLSQRASGRMRSYQKRCGQAALDNIARVDCGLAPWMWCGFRHAGEFNLFRHSAVPSRNNTRRLPGYRQSFFGRITGSPAQFKPLIRLFLRYQVRAPTFLSLHDQHGKAGFFGHGTNWDCFNMRTSPWPARRASGSSNVFISHTAKSFAV